MTIEVKDGVITIDGVQESKQETNELAWMRVGALQATGLLGVRHG